MTEEGLSRWRAVGFRARQSSPESQRARAYQLRDVARQIHPLRRCADCGFRAVGEVGVMRRTDGAHTIGGVLTCGSVWSCPACALTIKSKRAEQIKRGVELHRMHFGANSLAMLTLTVRHDASMPLRKLMDGYQAAHNDFFRLVPEEWKARKHTLDGRERERMRKVAGVPNETWQTAEGFAGYISGAETTWGRNGWHYHRHYVFAFEINRSAPELRDLRELLSEHWRQCVVRHLGEACEPSDERGCDLRHLQLEAYISKLGLEVSDVGTKSAGNGNVTHWGLMSGAANGNGHALDAFVEYVAATRGAKCVQISTRLQTLWGKLGAEVPTDDDAEEETVLVLELTKGQWMRLRMSGRVHQFLARCDEAGLPPLDQSAQGWGDQLTVEREALGGGRLPPEDPDERRRRLRAELAAFFDAQA